MFEKYPHIYPHKIFRPIVVIARSKSLPRAIVREQALTDHLGMQGLHHLHCFSGCILRRKFGLARGCGLCF
jgi:hypothetical protein